VEQLVGSRLEEGGVFVGCYIARVNTLQGRAEEGEERESRRGWGGEEQNSRTQRTLYFPVGSYFLRRGRALFNGSWGT
jgi:hypothetical protein